MNRLLSCSALNFSYRKEKPLLRNLDWSIHSGEIHCLSGKNGTGKTTLARILMGLQHPDGGRITWQDRDISEEDSLFRAGKIGLVMQNPDLQLFAATVEEEIAFGPRNLFPLPEEQERHRDQAIERFRLQALRGESPLMQTFGIRKRIALASVAAMVPPLYILDEPDWSMDQTEWAECSQWVREEASRGRAFLIISHNLEWMAELCTHQLILRGEGEWSFGTIRDQLYGGVFPGERTDLIHLAGEMEHHCPITPDEWLRDYRRSRKT